MKPTKSTTDKSKKKTSRTVASVLEKAAVVKKLNESSRTRKLSDNRSESISVGDSENGVNQRKSPRKKKQRSTSGSGTIQLSESPESEPDEDEDEEEDYVVEAIRDVREARHGGKEYLIKWIGYKDADNTWEPEDHLSCPDILAAFKEKRKTDEGTSKDTDDGGGASSVTASAKKRTTPRLTTVDVLESLGGGSSNTSTTRSQTRAASLIGSESSGRLSSAPRAGPRRRLSFENDSSVGGDKKKKSPQRINKKSSRTISSDNEGDDDYAPKPTSPRAAARIASNGSAERKETVNDRRKRPTTTANETNGGVPTTKKTKKNRGGSSNNDDMDEDESDDDDDDNAPRGIPDRILCADREVIDVPGIAKKIRVKYAVQLRVPGGQPKYEIWSSEMLGAIDPRLINKFWEESAYWKRASFDARDILGNDEFRDQLVVDIQENGNGSEGGDE